MGPINHKVLKVCKKLEAKNELHVNWVGESDEQFEYLDKFDFIFETNLGYESGDRVGAFDEKKQK